MTRQEWERFFRDAYQFGSPHKVVQTSPAVAAELRELFGDPVSPAYGLTVRIEERADVPPNSAYVLDA